RDARTGVFAVNETGNFFADRRAGDRQRGASSEIRLNENCDRETLRRFILSHFDVDLARRSPVSAFEFVTNHSSSSADAPLLNRAAVRGVEGMKYVFRLYMESVRVVEKSIPRFRDQRQTPPITARIRRAVFDSP